MKIHYITPFAVDKNIGREYNERIEELPDDCWIVLRDGDTLFLTPEWGRQIEAIVERNKDSFQLISCVTNRLRATHQLHENSFSGNGDINHHVNIANTLQEDYYDEVHSTTTIAGLCMIFKKETWKQHPFKENTLKFDTLFCSAISKAGGKIGIAKGLYLFHLYRWGKENPADYIDHLI